MKRFIVSALFISLVISAISTVGAGEAGAPPLDPMPKVAPLVPNIANIDTLTPEEKLQRRLESLVRDRDSRIQHLLDQRGDLRPADDTLQHATLENEFRERNQAREDLRRALEMYDERGSSKAKDVLAANRPIEQAIQRSMLAATNQLRIAECYYDLSLTSQPLAKDLSAGVAALDLIELNELDDGDPVRYRYLRAWFLIEQARLAKDDTHAALVIEATNAVERLSQDFPNSELTLTARSLLTRLTTPTAVKP